MKNYPILRANKISLKYRSRASFNRFFEHTAIDGITFSISSGETLGILGRNGCGKSSLLRILAGIVKPTTGKIYCDNQVTRALLTLGLGFRPELSGRDNALLSTMLQGKSKSDATRFLDTIKEFSELESFFEQPVRTYSSGMRARLGFAIGLMTKVDILLIDEILSVGDMHFREKAENALLAKFNDRQTIVLVSHNPQQIHKLCDRAIWLNEGIIEEQGDTEIVSQRYREFAEQQHNLHRSSPK